MKIIYAAFPNNERIVGGSDVSSTSFAPWQVWIFTHFDQVTHFLALYLHSFKIVQHRFT